MNADNTAEAFVKERRGQYLLDENRYYRFSVEQGMGDIELNDSDEKYLERMDARITAYLNKTRIAKEVVSCIKQLINASSECM